MKVNVGCSDRMAPSDIWQMANPTLADVVPVEKDYVIYRDVSIVMTKKGIRARRRSNFQKWGMDDYRKQWVTQKIAWENAGNIGTVAHRFLAGSGRAFA